MTIDEIAQQKIVEEIANNLNKLNNDTPEDIQDLIQDTYVHLLEKKDDIEKIPDKEIKYYITKYLKNNIFSVTSRYHYKYRKVKERMVSIDEFNEYDKNDNDV